MAVKGNTVHKHLSKTTIKLSMEFVYSEKRSRVLKTNELKIKLSFLISISTFNNKLFNKITLYGNHFRTI